MKDGKIIGEEVNKEKRSLDYFEKKRQEELKKDEVELPSELKLLMRTFKNLTPAQMGSLLVPFKAKQLLSHVVSELNEEQLRLAENFLREVLFDNMRLGDLSKKLDLRFEEGGANWNKRRAQSFAMRIEQILEQAKSQKAMSQNAKAQSHLQMGRYLETYFNLHLDDEMRERFYKLMQSRFESKIDSIAMKNQLDLSKAKGGVGLNTITAEKIVREVEIIMLINFSG
jgi:hypothetical protein